MTYWVIPANPKMYNALGAFNDLKKVHWQQGRTVNFKIGDIVYVYQSKTTKKLILKTKIIETNVTDYHIDDHEYVVGDTVFKKPWITLELLDDVSLRNITLDQLRSAGLKGNIQSACILSDDVISALGL